MSYVQVEDRTLLSILKKKIDIKQQFIVKTPIAFRHARLKTKSVAVARKHYDDGGGGVFREKHLIELNYPHCLFYDYYSFNIFVFFSIPQEPRASITPVLPPAPQGYNGITSDATFNYRTVFFNKGFPTCTIIRICLAYSITRALS